MTEHWVAVAARRAGLDGAEQLRVDRTLATARAWGDVAAALGMREEDLAPAIARHFRLQVADLGSASESALKLVPEQVVRQHGVLPLRQTDRELVVATSDPSDLELEQALGFSSGRQPVFEVAPPAALREAIERQYPEDRPAAQMLSRLETREREDVRVVGRFASEVEAARGGESAAVIRLTNLILRAAIGEGASRMELSPVEGGGRITLLVGGVERHFMQMPASAMTRVIARLNVLAHLGLPHRTQRQAGSTRMQVGGKTYDVAITVAPVAGGHRSLVKFAEAGLPTALAELGLPAATQTTIRSILAEPDGLFLLTGPPASGKTTLLYAAAAELAGSRQVATLEEAIERTLQKVPQHRPELLRGIDPVQALYGALASGAAVLFVDAPLDAPMLELLYRAARSGRLVVATMETGDAIAALRHVTENGLSNDQLAHVLKGVTGQRLLRRLCDACAVAAAPPTAEELRLAAAHRARPLRRPVGCPACAGTGYAGLTPAADAAAVGPAVLREVRAGAWDGVIRALREAGFRGAAEAAVDRVAEGATSIDEIDRAFGTTVVEPVATRVLVADDDPETVLLARTVLEKGGFDVADAPDGEAALERIAREPFALVILDLNMPRLDGRDVLKRLKSRVATAGLPVIVLTGSTSPEDEVMMMEEGAEDYIRKPIDPPRFLARVKAALRRTGAPA